jgi:hypothetical protein
MRLGLGLSVRVVSNVDVIYAGLPVRGETDSLAAARLLTEW